jgi:Sulfotransferase domain
MRLKMADPDNTLDLRYEDLCAAPEQHLRRMMTFLGYDMVPEQLDRQRYSATTYAQRPGHARLKQSIGSDTVGQWRVTLPKELQTQLERIAGPQMRALGYALEASVPAAA